jgi:antitoxin ParD1/3/4
MASEVIGGDAEAGEGGHVISEIGFDSAVRTGRLAAGKMDSTDNIDKAAARDAMSRADGPRLAKFANRGRVLSLKGSLHMPTRNISLTPEQDAFVEKVVQSGEYQNASEADALRVLQQRRQEDALKALRAQIKAGVEAIEGGDFVDVDAAELDNYLAQMEPSRHLREGQAGR